MAVRTKSTDSWYLHHVVWYIYTDFRKLGCPRFFLDVFRKIYLAFGGKRTQDNPSHSLLSTRIALPRIHTRSSHMYFMQWAQKRLKPLVFRTQTHELRVRCGQLPDNEMHNVYFCAKHCREEIRAGQLGWSYSSHGSYEKYVGLYKVLVRNTKKKESTCKT